MICGRRKRVPFYILTVLNVCSFTFNTISEYRIQNLFLDLVQHLYKKNQKRSGHYE